MVNIQTPKVTAQEFYKLWLDITKNQQEKIFDTFTNNPVYTSTIIYDEDSIIKMVAKSLEMRSYNDYYCIDTVLFKEEDLVPVIPKGQTWIRKIRIAFENENFFKRGLFQEVGHLLITNCDLRVVVSYPNSDEELENELIRLHNLITGVDIAKIIAQENSFLFIAGWPDNQLKEVLFDGYVFKDAKWEALK